MPLCPDWRKLNPASSMGITHTSYSTKHINKYLMVYSVSVFSETRHSCNDYLLGHGFDQTRLLSQRFIPGNGIEHLRTWNYSQVVWVIGSAQLNWGVYRRGDKCYVVTNVQAYYVYKRKDLILIEQALFMASYSCKQRAKMHQIESRIS